jgi:hypothetical protein
VEDITQGVGVVVDNITEVVTVVVKPVTSLG